MINLLILEWVKRRTNSFEKVIIFWKQLQMIMSYDWISNISELILWFILYAILSSFVFTKLNFSRVIIFLGQTNSWKFFILYFYFLKIFGSWAYPNSRNFQEIFGFICHFKRKLFVNLVKNPDHSRHGLIFVKNKNKIWKICIYISAKIGISFRTNCLWNCAKMCYKIHSHLHIFVK